jgi:Ca2+-binding EF-hand superfamily protein
LGKWKDHTEKTSSGKFSWLGGGLTYIPNLNEYGRIHAYRKYLSNVFEMYDEDEDGFLKMDDLKRFFQRIGATPIVNDPAKLEKAFKEGDEFNTGTLTVADFVDMMNGKLSVPDHVLAEFSDLSLGGPSKSGPEPEMDDDNTLAEIFEAFDADKDGFLGLEDLRKALMVMGAPLGAEEVKSIFAAADTDKDGKLSLAGSPQTIS